MRTLTRLLQNEHVVAVLVGLIVLPVYLSTMCPTASWTDSGELAAVATTMGIAHPTGYPLFTLLGRLSVMVPISAAPIVKLNLFSVFLTSIAAVLFFSICLLVLRSPLFTKRNCGSKPTGDQLFVAMVSSFVMAYSSTFWSQSTSIEVYALHLVLVFVCTIFFVRGLEEQRGDFRITSPSMIAFAFILGLCFSNHLTTVLLAPAFLYLYFSVLGNRRESWRLIVRLALWFVMGLSIYLYLPIRSSEMPALDWGHPATFERFWWHLSGKQYRVWMFEGMDVVKKQLSYYVDHFTNQFGWPTIAVLLVGAAASIRTRKRFAIFTSLLFLTVLFYSLNYDIHEIEPYFLLSYVACGLLALMGIQEIVSRVWATPIGKTTAVVVCASLVGLQWWQHKTVVDESNERAVEEFTRSVFDHVEPNAMIFSSLWDYFISPSLYFQHAEKRDSGVTVIDKSLLQNRSWYFLHLKKTHPIIYANSEPAIRQFLVELDKFERDEPFNPVVIQSKWDALLADLVDNALKVRPVYVDYRIEAEFPRKYVRTPAGLLVRLSESSVGDPNILPMVIKSSVGVGVVPNDLLNYVRTSGYAYGLWLRSRGDTAKERIVMSSISVRIAPW